MVPQRAERMIDCPQDDVRQKRGRPAAACLVYQRSDEVTRTMIILNSDVSTCNHVYLRFPGMINALTCIYCGKEKRENPAMKFTLPRWMEVFSNGRR